MILKLTRKKIVLNCFLGIILTNFIAIASASTGIRVQSWNAKHLGRKGQDLNASAILLQDADVVAIQEINKSKTGIKALKELAKIVSKKAGHEYCIAISDIPTDSLERYGFIWREDRLSYVTTAGKVMDSCLNSVVTTPVIKEAAKSLVREPSYITLIDRIGKAKISLITVHLVPTAKKPEFEVEPLFRAAASLNGKWCRVVLGDFNLGSDHSSFGFARTAGFIPAFGGDVKTSLKRKTDGYSMAYDNIWTQNCSEVTGQAVGNPNILGMSQVAVYDVVSDHMPISVTIIP